MCECVWLCLAIEPRAIHKAIHVIANGDYNTIAVIFYYVTDYATHFAIRFLSIIPLSTFLLLAPSKQDDRVRTACLFKMYAILMPLYISVLL